jgi:hypothetical protein
MCELYRLILLGAAIASVAPAFACPPNVINGKTVAMSSDECTAWTAAQPTQAQLSSTAAMAAASQGIRIISASSSALNGTYPVTPQDQAAIQAQQVSILTQHTFLNGQTTLPFADISGAYHLFPSTVSFAAFATAYGAYVSQLQMGKAPSNPVTIP